MMAIKPTIKHSYPKKDIMQNKSKKTTRLNREDKIELIRKAINLGTKNKPKSFFLRKEMEAICFSITGNSNIVSSNANVLFRTNLTSFGYLRQNTVDTHPIKSNLDFILRNINSKRKSSGVNPVLRKQYK